MAKLCRTRSLVAATLGDHAEAVHRFLALNQRLEASAREIARRLIIERADTSAIEAVRTALRGVEPQPQQLEATSGRQMLLELSLHCHDLVRHAAVAQHLHEQHHESKCVYRC